MLTGKDPISLQVLDAFKDGGLLATIAAEFNLSLDQVKRLKRYYNYQQTIHSLLDNTYSAKFSSLGTKALFLATYIKSKNTQALREILAVVDENTTRDELQHFIQQYEQKKQRIINFENAYEEHLKKTILLDLQYKEKQLLLENSRAQLDKIYDFAAAYPEEVKELLIHFIGPYQEGHALRRRLDSGFRRTLQKKGIIHLNKETYVWEILSLDAFAEQLAYRLNRGYRIKWDAEIEAKNNRYGYSSSEDYTAIKSYTEELQLLEKEILGLQKELKMMQHDENEMLKDLNKLKSTTLKSFKEVSIASDLLSERELLRHKELQHIAMTWLYNAGYVAAAEVTLPNGQRADVIGYNDSETIIIEVKASGIDYYRDQKWRNYLPYCNKFFFLLDFHIPNHEKDAGYLQLKKGTTIYTKYASVFRENIAEDIRLTVARALSRRLVFGWN